VIVYAGAIAVLFVFAIMVLIPGRRRRAGPAAPQRWLCRPGGRLPAARGALRWLRPASRSAPPPARGGAEPVGRLLLTDFLFPFEVTSVLLLAALVGVMALTSAEAS
jgi:NADH-quinone oxidoreductase subunit J